MDKGIQKEKLTPEEALAQWKKTSQTYRDRLLMSISALESAEQLEKRGTGVDLKPSWTTEAYKYIHGYLDAIDALFDTMNDFSLSLKTLAKRLELLEAEHADQTKRKANM